MARNKKVASPPPSKAPARKRRPPENPLPSSRPAPENLTDSSNKPLPPGPEAVKPETLRWELPIVGIGASAGGLEAFEQFLRNMPPDSGMGFILIPRLDPRHSSLMPEFLERFTRMKVVEAEHDLKVEANRVYTIPPNKDMAIKGGTLQLSSPGQGATFEIFLPKAEGRAEEPAPAALPRGNGELILLVDDEEAVLQSLTSLLERLGYIVQGVNDSRKAWEIFRARPESFEMVITDHIMPGMTGIQLAKKVLAVRPDLPILLVTGFSEDVSEDEAKAVGVREFLLKPSTTQTLSRVVHRLLNTKL